MTATSPELVVELVKPEKLISKLIAEIKVSLAKGEEGDRHWIIAGQKLAELKAMKPKGERWDGYVRQHFDLSQQRADELIRIAEGRTTLAEVRNEKKVSVAKTRAKIQTLRSVDAQNSEGNEVTENPEKPRADFLLRVDQASRLAKFDLSWLKPEWIEEFREECNRVAQKWCALAETFAARAPAASDQTLRLRRRP
jgi:hypothetical protein